MDLELYNIHVSSRLFLLSLQFGKQEKTENQNDLKPVKLRENVRTQIVRQ